MNAIVFDIETQKTAQEVGGWENAQNMGVAAIGAWRSDSGMYRIWMNNFTEFVNWCNWANVIVGYNHIGFDYKVLKSVMETQAFNQKHNVDLSLLVKRATKKYHGLDKVAYDTLGLSKTEGMSGQLAPQLFKDGKIDKLFTYLLDDVQLTVKLFYHILKYKEIVVDSDKYKIEDHIATLVETEPPVQLELF